MTEGTGQKSKPSSVCRKADHNRQSSEGLLCVIDHDRDCVTVTIPSLAPQCYLGDKQGSRMQKRVYLQPTDGRI